MRGITRQLGVIKMDEVPCPALQVTYCVLFSLVNRVRDDLVLARDV